MSAVWIALTLVTESPCSTLTSGSLSPQKRVERVVPIRCWRPAVCGAGAALPLQFQCSPYLIKRTFGGRSHGADQRDALT